MKISVFTTITDPDTRGDNWIDAFRCYEELSNEMIIVDGASSLIGKDPTGKRIGISSPWPQEFDWPFIGEQFQRGYEAATGDWVIHADIDFIFHENDFTAIRKAFEEYKDEPALSFWKYQFILPDRYNIKSRLVIAVNKKKFGDRIRFDSGGDLCQPSFDGKYLDPSYVKEARLPFYNYEKMTKNLNQITEDCGRMERAYFRHFGRYQMSSDGSDEDAFNCYIRLMQGRFNKPQEHIKLEKHPKFVQGTISALKYNQFGYNGLGLLGDTNDYMKEGLYA